MSKQLYFNKLDYLRFIAFLLVIWQHVFNGVSILISDNPTIRLLIDKLTITGGIGVQIFFVISGFLITFLMFEEEDKNGNINILHFYIRRFLRIWPLYYLVMVLEIFVLPNLFNTFTFNGNILKHLLFLNNLDKDHTDIAWSVAIEEQFYLFWPLVFTFLKNKKALSVFILLSFLLSTLFVIFYPEESYYHTFANIRFLMIGCFGALIYSKYKSMQGDIAIFNAKNTFLAYIFIVIFILVSPFSAIIANISLITLPILFLFVVISLVSQSKGTNISPISRLGKYTYGMYLYHPSILVFTKMLFDFLKIEYREYIIGRLFLFIITLTATIIISYLSYEFFEKKVLRYKNKFSIVQTRI